MAYDSLKIQVLIDALTEEIADGTITLATVKAYRSAARAELISGTTIVSINLEGGGSTAIENCNPAERLAACNSVIAAAAAGSTGNIGTGCTHIDFSLHRLET